MWKSPGGMINQGRPKKLFPACCDTTTIIGLTFVMSVGVGGLRECYSRQTYSPYLGGGSERGMCVALRALNVEL